MKVLHICLAAFYIDNFSYQENLLPKFHKKNGYDVEILASLVTFDSNGEMSLLPSCSSYKNEDDIKVTRLNYKKSFKSDVLRKYEGTYDEIVLSEPDIIFIHGCQFSDMESIVRYKKKRPDIRIYVDNHADFSNSATNWLSKNILHKIIWKSSAKKILPYTEQFYGVLPARVEFLKEIYKVPDQKVSLLVMGSDDEFIKKYKENQNHSKELKEKLNIPKEDFVIISGGKIDHAKRQIFNLIEAVKTINNVKLVIFGSVVKDMEEEFLELVKHPNVIYVGWINNEETYQYLSVADLAVYPGRHSVYWEQTAGMGIPMVVKYWEGTTHIDVGGNCKFLYQNNSNEIRSRIIELLDDREKYEEMLIVANGKGKSKFSYFNIAKKSLNLY